MRTVRYLPFCLVFVLVFPLVFPAYAKHHALIITGRIVAEESPREALSSLSGKPSMKTFIVRIVKRRSGRELSRYIRVNYEYVSPATKAKNLSSSTRPWKMELERDLSCDGPLPPEQAVRAGPGELREAPPRAVRWVVATQKDSIAPDYVLPCYQLHENDFKAL